MQIKASASVSNSLNRNLEEKKLLEELTDLLIGKKFYHNEKTDMGEIKEKYEELDFLDDLIVFEYIEIKKIDNNKISFLHQNQGYGINE